MILFRQHTTVRTLYLLSMKQKLKITILNLEDIIASKEQHQQCNVSAPIGLVIYGNQR
jgi:hypothetical protein